MATVEEQIELELSSFTRGIERYNKQMDVLTQKGLDSKTLHGRAIIKAIVEPLTEGVKEVQRFKGSNRDIAYTKLKGLDPEIVAYITLVSVVDSFSQHSRLIKVARTVGANIELEQRIQQWEADDKEVARNVLKKALEKTSGRNRKYGVVHKINKDYPDTEWREEEKIHVGIRLIDQLIIRTGLVSLEKLTTARNKTATFVKATGSTLDWISKFNEHKSKLKPVTTPCIIKPKHWTDVVGGGYHNDVMKPLTVVRNN